MAFLIKSARNIWANLAALGRGPIRYPYLGDHTAIASLGDLPKAPHCEIVLSRDVPPGAR